MCRGESRVLRVLVLLAAILAGQPVVGGGHHGVAAAAVHADFAGAVQVVGLGARDQGEPLRYQVSDEPRLQIGSAHDGESALHRVTGAIRLPDGRFVVANAGTHELKFFDSSGVHLASTGQRGDGPGDFEHISLIGALADGRIAAMDMMLGRVSVFSADGVHERTYRVSSAVSETGSRIEMHGFLADGTLVGLREVADEGTEARYGDYPASVLVYSAPVVQPVLVDTLGQAVPFARPLPGHETLDEIQSTSGGGALSVSGFRVSSMPLLKSAAVDVRDTLIVIGHTSGFDVRRNVPRRPLGVFDADGGGRSFVSFDLDEPAEAPEGIREAWVDRRVSMLADRGARREWRSRYEEFMSANPAVLPRFKSVLLQTGGNVWVERFDPAADAETPSQWWVIDMDWRTPLDPWENLVELPPGFLPYVIGSDYVLGRWRDELGIEYVRVYDLIEM